MAQLFREMAVQRFFAALCRNSGLTERQAAKTGNPAIAACRWMCVVYVGIPGG